MVARWIVVSALLASCTPTDSSSANSQPSYALGVAAGQCPPDVAFYHADPPGSTTELGVVAAAVEEVSYVVTSDDPEFDRRSDSATVTEGTNGHTFTIEVPMSAIDAISVSAAGASGQLPSTCDAVPL
jgi:hypothetical protein